MFSQDSISFEKTYDKIYKELAHKDLDKALHVADSLHQISTVPLFQVRSLILMARLYQQKEELDKTIELALKAEALAKQTGIYEWQARANGLLAGQYRMMGVYARAKIYSERALELIPQIKDPEKANNTRALMLQELAFSSKEQDDYRQAIRYLEEANESLRRIKDNREFLIMSNERLLADNYRLLESYDTAILYYEKARTLSVNKPTHYVIGLIYRGAAEAWLGKGDLGQVKKYLDKAEQIANESQYLQLKEAVYATAKEYYARVKDQERLAASREKKDSVTGEILEKRASLLDKTFSQIEEEGQKTEIISKRKSLLILSILVLFAFCAVLFAIYRKKKQEELRRFKHILEQLRNKEKEDAVDVPAKNEEIAAGEGNADHSLIGEKPGPETREKTVMTTGTEQKLLAELKSFEQSALFLDNSLSLTSLATSMHTNTKYLSYIIKTYKETDFNSYINALRVNYIVEKLKNTPEWRKYKIKTLAAEGGFSSHSQFATIFKTFIGLSPSVFIRLLEEGKQN